MAQGSGEPEEKGLCGQRAAERATPGARGRGLPAASGAHRVTTGMRADLRRIARAVTVARSPDHRPVPRRKYRATTAPTATINNTNEPGASWATGSQGWKPRSRDSMGRRSEYTVSASSCRVVMSSTGSLRGSNNDRIGPLRYTGSDGKQKSADTPSVLPTFSMAL